MTAPRIVRTRIRHVRRTPIRHAFDYRSYSWLVDLDAPHPLPAPLRSLARFRSADHLGDPRRSLRENVEDFLAEHAVAVPGGQILMLANARVLGYVFNPLTLYWCRRADGTLAGVVAEVHNTYGGRHRYLLRPDRTGTATATKEFYVSPFNPVAGSYRLTVPVPDDRLGVSIALRDPDGAVLFAATMTGTVYPATPAVVLRALLGTPLAPLAVAARIRVQGLRLWARGLPIVPRPQEVRR